MTQESKVEFIKTAVAGYYEQDVSCITSVRKSDPNYILRWICCYFLRTQLKMKYREIAEVIYNNSEATYIFAIIEKLEIKMKHSRELRNAINNTRITIEERFNLIAA